MRKAIVNEHCFKQKYINADVVVVHDFGKSSLVFFTSELDFLTGNLTLVENIYLENRYYKVEIDELKRIELDNQEVDTNLLGIYAHLDKRNTIIKLSPYDNLVLYDALVDDVFIEQENEAVSIFDAMNVGSVYKAKFCQLETFSL